MSQATPDQLCFVDPLPLENRTIAQTNSSAIDDIVSECISMSEEQLKKCKIPKIIHSVAIGGNFNFHHYLSLKSIHKHIRPDAIYMHGYDFPFHSSYFNQSLKEFNIKLVHSRVVSKVFNNTVMHAEHKSDVVRLESLIRFGGMYFDLDVYALQNIDDLLRGSYDFVIAAENHYGLNNGVMFSKRCAKFPLEWYNSYQHFNGSLWNADSIIKPKELYTSIGEKNNSYRVYVDESLNSDWGTGLLFKNESETPEFWKKTRIIHSFWRDHGKEYNLTSASQLPTNLGKLVRELFNE